MGGEGIALQRFLAEKLQSQSTVGPKVGPSSDVEFEELLLLRVILPAAIRKSLVALARASVSRE